MSQTGARSGRIGGRCIRPLLGTEALLLGLDQGLGHARQPAPDRPARANTERGDLGPQPATRRPGPCRAPAPAVLLLWSSVSSLDRSGATFRAIRPGWLQRRRVFRQSRKRAGSVDAGSVDRYRPVITKGRRVAITMIWSKEVTAEPLWWSWKADSAEIQRG